MRRIVCSLLWVAVWAGWASARAQPRPVELMAGSARVRVEALDPGLIRIWMKPAAGAWTREASLATDDAPNQRMPLTLARSGEGTRLTTEELVVDASARHSTFALRSASDGLVLIPDATVAWDAATGGWTLTHGLAAGERLLGLGQDNRHGGRLDRRGVVRELWAGQQIKSGNVTAEYPIPLLIGLKADGTAYGLFVDNVHRLRFDLGATRPDELKLTADGGEMDLYLIAGPKIASVIERYTRLTGRPSLPPLWALGYWQSKCTYYDWAALDEAYGELNRRGFPVDAMVIDYDWPEVLNDFQWAKRWFVEGRTPADRVREYARRGVKIVLSESGPMLQEQAPTYQPGWKAGVFATDGQGHPVEAGYYHGKLLDFTAPGLQAWLWPQIRERTLDGIAGWWLDLTEPEGEPPQAHYVGGTPANIHNQYSQLVTRSFEGAQLAANPDRRPFELTRTGSAGSQAHHAAVWTGDIFSDYPTLRAHPPEMLNSGLSGLVWWTCDTGGFLEGYYRDDQMGAHARLYERWMEFSAFSPVTRAHKAGGRPEPYQFGPAVEETCRHYLRLRYRLMPYIYSFAWQASRTGLPLTRPLALEDQEDPGAVAAPGDEYLFGHELLVAPVLREGATRRQVYFPRGRWYDFDTGEEYTGGRTHVVAAPQNRIPVAVRGGAIIPQAPDMRNTGERPWDPLRIEVWPEGNSHFTIYRDDGAGFGYLKGEYTTTELHCTARAGEVVLTVAESNRRFAPRSYEAVFHLERRPGRVTDVAGRPIPHSWSPASRALRVSFPAPPAGRKAEVRVALTGEALPRRLAPELPAPSATDESAGSDAGRPTPRYYPPPVLPGAVSAANYDNGGEGVAFHSLRPLATTAAYRPDDFGVTRGGRSGLVLAGLRTGEWARYSVNAGNGGWFDLTVRAASSEGGGRVRLVEGDRNAAVFDVPATAAGDHWTELTASAVYLNAGDQGLVLFVEKGGVSLDGFDFAATPSPPTIYPAGFAARRGMAELRPGAGPEGTEAVGNLCRSGAGTRLTWGVVASRGGPAILRLRYRSDARHPLAHTLAVLPAAPVRFELPGTAGAWSTFDVPVLLEAGANRVELRPLNPNWESVLLSQLQLLPPASHVPSAAKSESFALMLSP